MWENLALNQVLYIFDMQIEVKSMFDFGKRLDQAEKQEKHQKL